MEGLSFSAFFQSVGVSHSIRVTLIMGFWSTLISSVLGVAIGLWLARHQFPGKRLVIRINRTMMGAPPVAVGLFTYLLLRKKGPLGFLRWVFTIKGMILAQVLIITPIISCMIYSYAVRTEPAVRNFAITMGANRLQTNLLVLREMRHEIYFAIVTGFGRSISEVGAVFLVGGNIKNATRTMTTTISTLKGAGEFEEGVYLGIVLMLMAFIIQCLADYFQKDNRESEND